MTHGLVKKSGVFRTRPVGVVESKGCILHFGDVAVVYPGFSDGTTRVKPVKCTF